MFMATATPAQAQATLSKAFSPSTIGPGSVATLQFTITNGGGSPVTGLAFTDVLPTVPGDVDIADPANASTDCTIAPGGAGVTAPAGGGTITFGDGQLGAGESCTVTVGVTASTPGVHTNPAIILTWNELAGDPPTSLPVDLTVDATLPGFSKSFAPSSVSLGGRSTLTFTIDNSLNASRVGNLDFTDLLPPGMVIADPADASTDCVSAGSPDTTLTASPGSGIITLDANGSSFSPGLEVLPAGSTCTVIVDVVATGAGTLDNVSGDLLAEFVLAGKASASLDVTVTPIALIKEFADDPVPPGTNATLDFTISNFDRNFSATGVAFTDDLTTLVPALAGLTFDSLLSNGCGGSVSGAGGTTIGLTGGTLAPDGSCTISVSLAVPVGATPGSYTNTTTAVSATVGGSPVVGNTASDVLFVEAAPIFTKEFIDDPTSGGSSVTLRFTITNTDPTSALTGIDFTDDLDMAIPGLAANSLVAASGLEPEPLIDPCGAGSLLTIPDPNDTLPPTFPPFPPDPTMLNFTGGSLAMAGTPGDSCTFDVTLDVPAGVSSGAYLNTTSLLTATPTGASPASDNLIIVAAPRLTKEFTNDPVPPGGTVTLEFTLSHPPEAAANATGISFTDDLNAALADLTANLPPSPDPPCGAGSTLTGSAGDTFLTFAGATLAPAQSCTFSVVLSVPSGASGSFTNTTSDVSATVGGLAVASAAASDVLNVTGLTFTKEFTDDPVIAGDTVTLRFTIINIHPTDDATGIAFSDDLAAVLPGVPDLTAVLPPAADTCGGTMTGPTFLNYTGGSVTAGSTCTIEVEVQVPAAAADGIYPNLTGSLTATQGGVVVVNPAFDQLTVNSNLLQLTKEFTDDPVAPGDPVTLEFILTNLDAAQAASGIDFSDDLGAALGGMTFDSELFNDCGATVAGAGTNMIDVTGASLTAGGTCTIRASLTVPGAAAAGLYTNTTSSVTATMGGLPVTGDPATDDLSVSVFTFSKIFGGPVPAGQTTTLEFTIENLDAGSGVANIAFTDNLDAVVPGMVAVGTPLADVCGAGSVLAGTSLLTFTGGNLPPGGSCIFSVDVQVPSDAPVGIFTNTTSVLSQGGIPAAEPASGDIDVVAAQLGAAIPATNPIGTFILIALLAAAAIWRLRWRV
jgi:uncharacterized repeat protein (TIGR01451 family)